MKALVARSLALIAVLALAAAEGGGILAAEDVSGLPPGAYLLPPRFRPGEVVELRLSIESDGTAGKRELQPPDRADEYEIRKVLLESNKKGATLSIFFVPWRSGTLAISPFKTEGIDFSGATVRVQSILNGDGEQVRPPRPYLLLPGTRTMVAVAISGLAAAVLACWAVIAFFIPLASRFLSASRARKPYKRFQHELRIMRKRMGDEDGAYFYALLSRAFRAYVSSALAASFASVTAGELKMAGEGGNDLPELGADRESVAGVLLRSDLVRFAERPSGREERAMDMSELSRVVDSLEADRAGA